MRSHYQSVDIEVVKVWAHRGNVERYFKYRYSNFNHPIGSLTEYFMFPSPDKTQAVERDLHQMPAKVLTLVEQEIIDGNQDEFIAAILAEGQMSLPIEAALQQYFLAKPSSQKIIAALHQGASLRDAAAKASVSVEVARKVLAVMQRA